MKKVEVDFGLCESNGVCMGIIPEVFDLDEQDYLHILKDEVTPDNEAEIREAISGQICRCTGYATIVRSIRWAAEHATQDVSG